MTLLFTVGLIIASVFLGLIGYTVATIGELIARSMIEILVELRRTNMILLMDMQSATSVSFKNRDGKVTSSMEIEKPVPELKRHTTFTSDV